MMPESLGDSNSEGEEKTGHGDNPIKDELVGPERYSLSSLVASVDELQAVDTAAGSDTESHPELIGEIAPERLNGGKGGEDIDTVPRTEIATSHLEKSLESETSISFINIEELEEQLDEDTYNGENSDNDEQSKGSSSNIAKLIRHYKKFDTKVSYVRIKWTSRLGLILSKHSVLLIIIIFVINSLTMLGYIDDSGTSDGFDVNETLLRENLISREFSVLYGNTFSDTKDITIPMFRSNPVGGDIFGSIEKITTITQTMRTILSYGPKYEAMCADRRSNLTQAEVNDLNYPKQCVFVNLLWEIWPHPSGNTSLVCDLDALKQTGVGQYVYKRLNEFRKDPKSQPFLQALIDVDLDSSGNIIRAGGVLFQTFYEIRHPNFNDWIKDVGYQIPQRCADSGSLESGVLCGIISAETFAEQIESEFFYSREDRVLIYVIFGFSMSLVVFAGPSKWLLRKWIVVSLIALFGGIWPTISSRLLVVALGVKDLSFSIMGTPVVLYSFFVQGLIVHAYVRSNVRDASIIIPSITYQVTPAVAYMTVSMFAYYGRYFVIDVNTHTSEELSIFTLISISYCLICVGISTLCLIQIDDRFQLSGMRKVNSIAFRKASLEFLNSQKRQRASNSSVNAIDVVVANDSPRRSSLVKDGKVYPLAQVKEDDSVASDMGEVGNGDSTMTMNGYTSAQRESQTASEDSFERSYSQRRRHTSIMNGILEVKRIAMSLTLARHKKRAASVDARVSESSSAHSFEIRVQKAAQVPDYHFPILERKLSEWLLSSKMVMVFVLLMAIGAYLWGLYYIIEEFFERELPGTPVEEVVNEASALINLSDNFLDPLDLSRELWIVIHSHTANLDYSLLSVQNVLKNVTTNLENSSLLMYVNECGPHCGMKKTAFWLNWFQEKYLVFGALQTIDALASLSFQATLALMASQGNSPSACSNVLLNSSAVPTQECQNIVNINSPIGLACGQEQLTRLAIPGSNCSRMVAEGMGVPAILQEYFSVPLGFNDTAPSASGGVDPLRKNGTSILFYQLVRKFLDDPTSGFFPHSVKWDYESPLPIVGSKFSCQMVNSKFPSRIFESAEGVWLEAQATLPSESTFTFLFYERFMPISESELHSLRNQKDLLKESLFITAIMSFVASVISGNPIIVTGGLIQCFSFVLALSTLYSTNDQRSTSSYDQLNYDLSFLIVGAFPALLDVTYKQYRELVSLIKMAPEQRYELSYMSSFFLTNLFFVSWTVTWAYQSTLSGFMNFCARFQIFMLLYCYVQSLLVLPVFLQVWLRFEHACKQKLYTVSKKQTPA
eukprot:Nk52_evm39s279 gene=Nk52_evmTU39s279